MKDSENGGIRKTDGDGFSNRVLGRVGKGSVGCGLDPIGLGTGWGNPEYA